MNGKIGLGIGLVGIAAVFGYFNIVHPSIRGWSASPSPKLICPSDVVVDQAENLAILPAEFTIRNEGGSLLELTAFATTCGCAGFERIVDGIPRAVRPFALAPGSSDTLRVRWSVRGVPGKPHSINVSFCTNDPNHPSWTIKLSVQKVLGGLTADPSRILLVDHARGIPIHRTVAIVDGRERQTPVTAIHRSGIPNWLNIDRRENGKGGFDLVLSGIPPADATPIDGSLQVMFAAATEPELELPVNIQVGSPFRVAPETLSLPRKLNGIDQFKANFVIRSLIGPEFSIDAAAVPGITTTIRPRATDSLVQVVQVDVLPDKARAGSEFELPIQVTPKQGDKVCLVLKIRINSSFTATEK